MSAAGIDVSVLVVSFRNPDLTVACLQSVFDQTHGVSFEVLVHDNDSDDGTPDAIAERVPQAQLTRDMGNLGFARANNHLARRARGEYLLLLNPDTLVLDGAVQRLHAALRRSPRSVPLGGRTLRPDGALDPSSCWGRQSVWSLVCFAIGASTVASGSRWLNPEAIPGWGRDDAREVGVVTGCLAMLPRTAWEELGGFDELFWMYGEDADLSIRAHRAGYRPSIDPSATIVHVVGASSSARGAKTVLVMRAKVALVRKHWTPALARLGVALLLTGVAVRAVGERCARRTGDGGPWLHAWRARAAWSRGFETPPPSACDA